MGLASDPAVMASEDIVKLRAYLPAMLEMANRPDATASFKNYVRLLKAKASQS